MGTAKLSLSLLLLTVITSIGCARAARDTTGFALVDTATVDAPFQEAWQAAKAVLREREFDIYTRDKRGVFVAYSRMRRNLMLVPKRTKYTIVLEPSTETQTAVTVETIRQTYGVTLLTYPDWHDRQATDNTVAQEILQSIQDKATGAEPVEAESEAEG